MKKIISYIFFSCFACSALFSQSIYNGGIGNGNATDCHVQADNLALNIYYGGISDGYALECYAQADNIAFSIYNGGVSDGYATDCYSQADNIALSIYNGGTSDGYATDCHIQADNPFLSIFNGGIGNGNAIFCVGTITEIPLPIELINFEAQLIDKEVFLTWNTLTEINNDYFTIQRSIDTKKWSNVSIVNGAGNSFELLNYITYDKTPHKNISYYRIKQTDFNGDYSYSDIRTINLKTLIRASVLIYPNPTTASLTVNGSAEELSNIKVYNVLGQNVRFKTTITTLNKSKIIIDLSQLTKGIYTITTQTTANKILKQ